MKRMFSKEEIEKIAEAVGGGLTPDDVKAILDDSLEYDDTTKGLINNAVAEYLENNPPVPKLYKHSCRLYSPTNKVLCFVVIFNSSLQPITLNALSGLLGVQSECSGTVEVNTTRYNIVAVTGGSSFTFYYFNGTEMTLVQVDSGAFNSQYVDAVKEIQ